jgi:hypothetical protein
VSGVAFNEGCASAADAPVKSESVTPARPKPVALLRVLRFAEFFARDILLGSCLGGDSTRPYRCAKVDAPDIDLAAKMRLCGDIDDGARL